MEEATMKIKSNLSLMIAILTVLAFLPAGRLAVLPSSAAAAQDLPTDPVTVDVWWWGETEAPGSEKWLVAAQKAYSEQHPNVTFTNNLLSTDALLPSYEAAGQAKEGPTIMYLWGGIYTMDAVWKGWIVPI
jgi:ABC-type glycerol-3-phosphate transport system substrate-binding protein